MTLDINEPEVKAAIDSAIEDAVSGLKAKNIDLAARLEKARKGKEIDPDDHNALVARADKLESDLQALQKENKTLKTEYDKTKKAHETESAFTQKLLVDNGLVGELTKANITNPTLLKAAKEMLKSQVALVIDGENRKAMVGEKELSAFVTEWAASEEGKHFVSAPANSGGGAPLGGKGGSGVDVSKLSPMEKMELGRKEAK